jgi:carboxypeptidase family protein
MRQAAMSSDASALRSVVAALLFLLGSTTSATVCVSHKLSPLSHVCGFVVDRSTTPISNAKVTILKDGTEVIAVQTGADGQFNFQRLDAGNYDLLVEANGFGTGRYKVIAAKPDTACKKMLRVQLAVGIECPDIQIIKPKLK